jgi:FKBP-type peptidyl-prolyl cis-trans isomerase
MKHKLIFVLAFFIMAQVFFGCNKIGSGSPLKGENFDKDASYALGMNIGSSLAMDGIIPNLDEFLKGVRDSISGGTMRFDESEAIMKIQTAYQSMMEKRDAEATEEETAFLAENSKKPGVVITPSGLQYEVITETSGPKPTASDMVRVHYEGRLINGTVFDSSYDRGSPAEFPLGGVIQGWIEGLQLMSVGSKYRFFIPSELGYGSRGAGSIPPYSTLIFEVELLDIL